MRRIVAPAATVLSALPEFERTNTYLINGVLKLGQSVTHLGKASRKK